MTPLEVLAIVILAGVVIIIIYSYLQNDRALNLGRVRSDASNLGGRVYGEASNLGGKVQGGASNLGEKVSGEGSMSGMGEKLNVSGVSEKVSGIGESVSGMGEKIKGKVSGSMSTDDLSDRIDLFLNEKSDQLIKDWELATKDDIGNLEKRYNKVSRNLGELDRRFDEYQGSTNKKLKKIDERLDKLENPEE
ncbi:MAG: hypothetical protein Q8N08_08220 [Methanobacteriaceae archaeon]|nr:hypothetical protein [Methanobacteriaceae archaeon]